MIKIHNKKAAINFDELIEIIRKLRSPNGCSWDKNQTSESLIPYLLEEAYEIIEAIENANTSTLKEELGDLLLHIIFQAELAREKKQFDIADSIKHISQKLIRRHPHVFDEKNNNQSNLPWEWAKQKEKKRKNLLDGVPKNLPALIRARRIQEKAANVGFDWKNIEPVWSKIKEEIEELKEGIKLNQANKIKEEMGDILFSLVNLSRFLDISPEDALRMSISKFERRFSQVEKILKQNGKEISDSNLQEMNQIWIEIKKKELK